MNRVAVVTIIALAVVGASSVSAAQRSVGLTGTKARVGCYRLILGPWSGPLPPTGIPEAHTPPPRFRLDSTLLMRRGNGALAVEPAELWSGSRMAAAWRPLSNDSVSIVWSTGFVGVSLRMEAHGDTLRGRATTFHDAHVLGEPPDPSASVEAIREACQSR
jgi:hypothetical protein